MRRCVEAQLDALVARLGIAAEPSRRLLGALAGDALGGPFHDGRRRFSAINRDGVPFQWSVSVGSHAAGLRFIADCGVPGMSIPERVRYSRESLASLATWLPLGNALAALDVVLNALLPDAALLDPTLMGLCIAAELPRARAPRLKVYVNGEIGSRADRYRRVVDCLSRLDRPDAIRRLRAVAGSLGDRIVPAFVAVDLAEQGVGRLKLYLRPADGAPALQMRVAQAAGCLDASAALEPIHRAFLEGRAYPPPAVDLSIEFAEDDGEPGFKVDLRAMSFLDSDADADRRIRRLFALVAYSDAEYCTVRDIVVGAPSPHAVRQIVFIGLASRRGARHVDVYFHPSPVQRAST